MLVSLSAGSRIEPFRPATGFGPPAPLAASRQRTGQRHCALPPFGFIVLVRRIVRPGFINP
ncbi:MULTISPECIES: hypothetical protein [Burkholderia]|uniref:Uncharacterized protein n=1 Tax=Burkholderia anthinoferrum TaxID=3090833 RepID=A0ABU5WFW2_9BURK|nr:MULTISPECIES: hypothetical protein [Burkholderia]MEB2501590.1 hypothetical protein [Burkholderia anthinoferrum]MEB2530900.1 hypothetical protein [Burkholderia anthinoferrum]MEB2559612.1 hypothetical protein [Burkholderia anthinoferrum]MEB2577859.1 hypothetical protein [Burkholderia anthinoferrum]KVH03860.1 hypothetical protein WS85_32415 [Burkholderia anthina]